MSVTIEQERLLAEKNWSAFDREIMRQQIEKLRALGHEVYEADGTSTVQPDFAPRHTPEFTGNRKARRRQMAIARKETRHA